MNVVVTGAAGFIGRALVARLRRGAILRDASGREYLPDRLVLCDTGDDPQATGAAPATVRDTPRTVWRKGSVVDRDFVSSLVDRETAGVFHLAGIVSGAAEADFDAGIRVNLDGTRNLLDAVRAQAGDRVVRLVQASSIAVYGAPLPARIDDDTQPWPTLSYGAHKLAGELLIGDLSRRGLLDGRSVRLSGVVVRPAQPNGALSAFNSDLIREPLAGRPVVSPVSRRATIWLQSLVQTVDNLLHAMNLDAPSFGQRRAVLLPAIACSIEEVVDAITQVAGKNTAALVEYRPDDRIEPMFGRWPRPFTAVRGLELGFGVDPDVLTLVRNYAQGRPDAGYLNSR